MSAADVRRSLCCECGNLRTVKAASSPRHHQPEPSPDSENQERMLEDLKCSPCGKITRHAIIRRDDDRHRNHAEERDRRAAEPKTGALDVLTHCVVDAVDGS